MGVQLLTDWKKASQNAILVIVKRLTNIFHSQCLKITIDTTGRIKVIFDVVVRHYSLPKLIIDD